MIKEIIDTFIEYKDIFITGAIGTLKYAAIAVALGTIIGTLIAILHLSKNKIINAILNVYVTVIRGTPLLVQMYIAWFFIPMKVTFLSDVSKEQCVMLALVLNSSAYVSEIIRGGILSVDKGQSEAARSLGMSSKNCMTKIVLPQAIKAILPAIGGEYISMIKETSLAGTFMMYELMYTRVVLANKYLIWQPLFVIAIIYLIMTCILTWLMHILEKRLAESD